jgi:hypothetical protein
MSKDSPRCKGNGPHGPDKSGGRASHRKTRYIHCGDNRADGSSEPAEIGRRILETIAIRAFRCRQPSLCFAKVEYLIAIARGIQPMYSIMESRLHSAEYEGNSVKEIDHLGLVKSPGFSKRSELRRLDWAQFGIDPSIAPIEH